VVLREITIGREPFMTMGLTDFSPLGIEK